ncbi:MAG TPA: hypothetical protein DCX03_04075 [Bacteroidales bacterium]|nr:hypothetical protein [Bacteroidales bacterium]
MPLIFIKDFQIVEILDFVTVSRLLPPVFNIQSFAVRKIKPPSAPRGAEIMKFQIPNLKIQINSKFQVSNPK